MTVIPQRIKLLTAKGKADTDQNGVADVVIKIPNDGRAVSGGIGYFVNQADGDYLTMVIKDDDGLVGDPGEVVGTYNDSGVPAANQGNYFLRDLPLEIKSILNDDPKDLPGGMYLHICGHKADINQADTLYVNVNWGKRA